MKSTQNITWHNENSEGGHKYSTSFLLHPFASTNPFFFLSSFTIYYHHHSNNPCQKLDLSWLFPLLYLPSPKFPPILSQVFWNLTGLSLIVSLLPKQLQILEKGAETWPHFSMLNATMATWSTTIAPNNFIILKTNVTISLFCLNFCEHSSLYCQVQIHHQV